MTKYEFTINSNYTDISDQIKTIPSEFETSGEDIYIGRNRIKVIQINNIPLNVKRFKKPIFINRLIYSFFRKPKAYKAYHNALKVLEKGFSTPCPIAFIEEKESNLLTLSYFVSSHLHGYNEIRDFYYSKLESEEEQSFFKAFASFTAQLHDAGIMHLDYSPGNILYSKQDDQTYLFSIVDINRMQFTDVDMKEGCKNFARLFEYDSVYEFIAPFYAKERKLDKDTCKKLLVDEKNRFHAKKHRKKKLKKLLKY